MNKTAINLLMDETKKRIVSFNQYRTEVLTYHGSGMNLCTWVNEDIPCDLGFTL